MKVEYDKPIEVTKSQYGKLMRELSGIICGREVNGKYFIKVWFMRYATYVESELNYSQF